MTDQMDLIDTQRLHEPMQMPDRGLHRILLAAARGVGQTHAQHVHCIDMELAGQGGKDRHPIHG